MPDNTMKEILLSCLAMEKAAAKLYREISEHTKIDEQSAFWRNISLDEKRHAAYWEKLLDFVDKRTLRNVFDRPDKTNAELKAMKRRIEAMLSERSKLSDMSSAILLALRLESLTVNPAFAILFHVMRKETGGKSPEDDYQEHLNKFVQFVKRFVPGKPELELIGEILSSMWAHNMELANQFVQIKTLQGMLPICASCKKIRDDKGYWNKIEAYLTEHTEARFSHGICPDCVKELYPEFEGRELTDNR
jgi:rubrerythrin